MGDLRCRSGNGKKRETATDQNEKAIQAIKIPSTIVRKLMLSSIMPTTRVPHGDALRVFWPKRTKLLEK